MINREGYMVGAERKQKTISLETEACRARAVDRKRIFAVVHVGGRASRYIFVDGGLLFIPSNAHTGALSKAKVELSAEDAGGASGGGLAEFLQRSPLLSNNHLNDEVVFDAHARLAVHVAKRLEGDVAGRVELDVDFTTFKVGLPASLDFLAGDGADVLMEDALALSTDLLDVLGASRCNEFLGLFDSPVKLAQPPSGLRVSLVLHDARQAHLNWEVTDRVDDRRQLH
jgi:hypothetical protein